MSRHIRRLLRLSSAEAYASWRASCSPFSQASRQYTEGSRTSHDSGFNERLRSMWYDTGSNRYTVALESEAVHAFAWQSQPRVHSSCECSDALCMHLLRCRSNQFLRCVFLTSFIMPLLGI
jgi:hypothetical protein